ncbi:MAG: efflux RND transporter periplasmic adaptor subunit [Mariprofundaceae bacterium]
MNKNLLFIVTALGLGLAGGYFMFGLQQTQQDGRVAESGTKGDGPCVGGAQPLVWRNPMNPVITSPTFTKDSMGMDYIPVCAEETTGAGSAPAGTVKIDPTVTQDIGVRVTRAVQKNLSREITTIGRITFDETKLVTLHPKVDGWVDKLFVDKTGESVKQDTMLLSFYSPQLVATQEEYLLALSNWQQLKDSPYADIRDGARRLLDSSLDRLRFFDVADHQIKELQKTHKVRKSMHIHAPAAGVVTQIGVREGAHVTPMSELYQIADLSRVWVLADLYEYEISWVKVGDEGRLRIASLPGRDFTGHITYIYPYLDPKTRTNKVRIEFDNAEGLLKPDMFGDVAISAGRVKSGVFVPRESVLITGKKAHLFVQTEPGRFEPRTVRTGASTDGLFEILEGLEAGELVVSSGQFLIDSESSIREAAAKMIAPKSKTTEAQSSKEMKGMAMEGMPMDDHSASRPKGKGSEVPNHMKMDGMNMDHMQMEKTK